VTLGKKTLAGLAALGFAVFVLALLLRPPEPAAAPSPSWRPSGVTRRGVFHVHTLRSDGTGTADEVAAAAARAGLQFVIFTDHGDATRTPDPPVRRSGVLCIDAVEISTTGGHYAAIGLGAAPYPLGGEPRDVVEDVHRLGGFGIVAHPYSARPDLAWTGWGEPFDAIEWLNGDSQWRDASLADLARASLTYFFRPPETLAALIRRPSALAAWSALTRNRRVVTLAGTDAHARIGLRDRLEPYQDHVLLKLPSYEAVFRSASIQVWLDREPPADPAGAAAAVVSAIRAGHVHTEIDGWAGPAAFEFTAESGGVTAREGDALPLAGAVFVRIRANVPAGGWIVLFRDGREVHRVRSGQLIYMGNLAGVYRSEVWVPDHNAGGVAPWIVSNPIYIGWQPVPVNAAQASWRTTAGIDAEHGWSVEHDSGSQGTLVRREGVLELGYRLGAGPKNGQFAALAKETTFGPDTVGIAFRGAADRPMRISVQVRVPDAGDGARWQRSVYLDQQPRDVTVELNDMRPAGNRGPGPRVAEVRSLLFVVDTINTRPGSAGSFTLRDVRVVAKGLDR
jgi:hypothetical protein